MKFPYTTWASWGVVGDECLDEINKELDPHGFHLNNGTIAKGTSFLFDTGGLEFRGPLRDCCTFALTLIHWRLERLER